MLIRQVSREDCSTQANSRIDAANHAVLAVPPLGAVEPDGLVVGDDDVELHAGRGDRGGNEAAAEAAPGLTWTVKSGLYNRMIPRVEVEFDYRILGFDDVAGFKGQLPVPADVDARLSQAACGEPVGW